MSYFHNIKIIKFRGDVIDVSAKTKTLDGAQFVKANCHRDEA